MMKKMDGIETRRSASIASTLPELILAGGLASVSGSAYLSAALLTSKSIGVSFLPEELPCGSTGRNGSMGWHNRYWLR